APTVASSLIQLKHKEKKVPPPVESKDHNSNSPCAFEAVTKGNLSDVEKILKDNHVNAVNSTNETLLHIAAAHGHTAIAEYLIKKGANLEAKDKKGRTPLHRAAERGHDNTVKMLLRAGANMYSLDQEAKSPLHLASQSYHTQVLKSILKEEARQHRNQHNFLHMAALRDSSDLVEMLLKNGALMDAKDEKGQTALSYAVSKGFEKTVKVLLEAGAPVDSSTLDMAFNNLHDVNALNEMQYTPLLVACEMGKTESAKVLIEKGASLNRKSSNSNSALHLAVQAGAASIAKMLLNKGMDANIVGQGNQTPLHAAAFHNKAALVDILIDRGAKIDAVTKDLLTPLHIASSKGHTEVAQKLLHSDPISIYEYSEFLAPMFITLHLSTLNSILMPNIPVFRDSLELFTVPFFFFTPLNNLVVHQQT
uniref:Uncharacterized protein n=1 Tax=Salvator merianae TaxID=96440 RepID=A0A8D0DXF2_SALMN